MKTTFQFFAFVLFFSNLAIGLAQDRSAPDVPATAEAQAATGLAQVTPDDEPAEEAGAPPASTEQPAPAATDASAGGEQPSAPAFVPYAGRVIGTNVNVRSGPSTNYYPVCQVNDGQYVRVVGTEHGWLRISPPPGVLSLIDQTFVDKGADGKGVVNGDSVWVRAGSVIPEHSRKKYAKQVKLNRGAILSLVGETEDGFYKVAPPREASVWIHGGLVERVPGADSFVWQNGVWTLPRSSAEAIESSADSSLADETSAPTESAAPATESTSAGASPDAAAGKGSPAEWEKNKAIDKKRVAEQEKIIAAVEKGLEAEFKKPLLERNLTPFIKQLEPIARQEAETATRIYAQQRLQQLKDQIESIQRVKHVNALAQNVLDARTYFSEQRKVITPLPPSAEGKYVVRGQFARSMVYSNPVGPRRYRIIDPNSVPSKTLAYVEVPPGREFHPDLYLGRFVGVRASGRRLQQGVVKPLPIFILEELNLLKESDVMVQAPAGENEPIGPAPSRVTEADVDEAAVERDVADRLDDPAETPDEPVAPEGSGDSDPGASDQ